MTWSRATAVAQEEVLESKETDLRHPSLARPKREALSMGSEPPIVTKRRATTQA